MITHEERMSLPVHRTDHWSRHATRELRLTIAGRESTLPPLARFCPDSLRETRISELVATSKSATGDELTIQSLVDNRWQLIATLKAGLVTHLPLPSFCYTEETTPDSYVAMYGRVYDHDSDMIVG